MTAILALFKNPKNILILVMALIIFIAGAIVLIQRASLASKTAKIEIQAKDIETYKQNEKLYQKQLLDYAGQIVKLKELEKVNQQITNQTASLAKEIKKLKSNPKVDQADAKTVNAIVDYFNSGRLRE